MRILISAGLLWALPAALHAEPLTFDVALDRAASQAPELLGSAAGVAAAESARISADRLPDPTLEVGIQDFPVTGPDAGSFNRDDFTMQRIGISQQFVNPAKRRARAARADAEIGIAKADQAAEQRNIRLATALAWIDLHFAKRRLDQLKLLDRDLGDLQSTVAARLTAGTARPSQALEPDQLRAEINDRHSALSAEVAIARARLVRYTGDPAADTAGPPPTMAIDRTNLVNQMLALPRLQLLDALTVAADAETRLARADKRPDWTVNASYGRREPNYGDLVSVGVSVDLPLFAKRRQDPKIAARTSEAAQAQYARAAAEREVVAALDVDLAGHRMHHDQLENARTRLVPLAKQRAELDLRSYAAGKLDLGTALLSTLALAEAEVEALARDAEVARDAVRINYTYGETQP